MLKGIFVLLMFQGIGEYTTYLTKMPIPSSVIGMLLLFLTLLMRNNPIPSYIESSSNLVIRFLYLFLIPSCVGCLFLIRENFSIWLYLLTTIFITTLLTIFFGSLLMKYFVVRHEKKIRKNI
ncbi:MAG: hypothetical protein CMK44_07590 [Porticoccus sp.]|jgi:holin-like protein|nr:hypothetical protein [Porticoccus sp.]